MQYKKFLYMALETKSGVHKIIRSMILMKKFQALY